MSQETVNSVTKLDIKKVFYSKNPKLARLIPGFIYRYLKRIIHQDYLNYILEKYGDKQDLDFIDANMVEFNVTIEVSGTEKLPRKGRFIFVSNHPLGGFDGLVILKVVSKYYSPLKFLVNDILMNIKNLGGLFLPINKHGKQGIESARTIEETYNSDTQVLTFPAGLVSRKIKGQIVDLVWQKNFIVKAVQHQRDVIPIHISGRNTNFFYRLANIRKALGIKSNIEMLYLVDETYKHHNKHLEVKFGKPISWQTFDKTKKPIEWAKWVKEKAYELDGVTSIPL